jgi:hypothetical protein
MSDKKPTLFDFIKQISTVKETYPYDKKIAPAYMLSMWLSHDKDLIEDVNEINKYQFLLPDEIIYKYYRSVVPKRKRYIKWVKKKSDKEFEKKVEEIQEKYPRLSKRELKICLRLKEAINENQIGKF